MLCVVRLADHPAPALEAHGLGDHKRRIAQFLRELCHLAGNLPSFSCEGDMYALYNFSDEKAGGLSTTSDFNPTLRSFL